VPYRKPALDLAHPAWFFVRKKKKINKNTQEPKKKEKERRVDWTAGISTVQKKQRGRGEISSAGRDFCLNFTFLPTLLYYKRENKRKEAEIIQIDSYCFHWMYSIVWYIQQQLR
jgi:hypothetical protein